VHLTLDPFAARREIHGPNVMLSAKNAQNLSLVLHELATNALKHGALSNPEGSVSIAWSIAGNGGSSALIRWQEHGGPPVIAPSRQGFGTMLIQATFSDVSFDYACEGLVCEIHVPLAPGEL